MNAVKCLFREGRIDFSEGDLPLEKKDPRDELLRLRSREGPVLYCITDSNAKDIKIKFDLLRKEKESRVDFLEYTKPDNHKGIDRIIGRPAIQLLTAPATGYTDPQRVPVAMVTRIRKLLQAAHRLGSSDLLIMHISRYQMNWIMHQVELQLRTRKTEKNSEPEADDVEGSERSNKTGSRAHPHSYTYSVLEDHDPLRIRDYGFEGQKIHYKSPYVKRGWGSFKVNNRKRSERPQFLHNGACPFCSLIRERERNRPMSTFRFEGDEYFIIWNENPIVTKQIIIVSSRSDSTQDSVHGHRIDINSTDVRLMKHLTERGLQDLELERCGNMPGIVPYTGDESKSFAAYVNAFPHTGRSIAHFHINCVFHDLVPLPPWRAAEWKISRGAENGATIARVSGSPFYSLTIECPRGENPGETIVRIHQRLNEIKRPYNLMAYPEDVPGHNSRKSRFVIVPRKHEYSFEVGQKLAGLEFLTGVCLPDLSRLSGLDPAVRNRALRHVTMGGDDVLDLERELRALFDRPPEGKAIYPRREDEKFVPKVLFNRIFEPRENGKKDKSRRLARGVSGSTEDEKINHVFAAERKYWRSGYRENEDDTQYSEWGKTANILVRVTRCSISQADRRFLRRTRADTPEPDTVLGHESGGYIVDPGPNKLLHAGQKVVLIPHLICKKCRFCRSFHGNLCENMRHMGMNFDGSFSQLIAVPPESVFPVEDSFPDDALPLVQPLACVLHVLYRIKDRFNHIHHDPVLFDRIHHPATVYGAGSMGCLTSIAIRIFWPDIPVLIIEPLEERGLFAADNEIGTHVENTMPAGDRSRVSIVTSNSLESYRHALAAVSTGGTVVVFAGIDTIDLENDDSGYSIGPQELQNIHQSEETRQRGLFTETSHTLVGSSGYNYQDIRRAVHELEHNYYSDYRKVQNIVINGLDATYATFNRPLGKALYPATVKKGESVSMVEAFLSPDGIADDTHGHLIKQSLKVLIRI